MYTCICVCVFGGKPIVGLHPERGHICEQCFEQGTCFITLSSSFSPKNKPTSGKHCACGTYLHVYASFEVTPGRYLYIYIYIYIYICNTQHPLPTAY